MKNFLRQIGIRDINRDRFEPHHVERLLKHLRRREVKFSEVISSVSNNIPGSPFAAKQIGAMVQEFLDLLPAHVGEALNVRKLQVQVLTDAEMNGAHADFQRGQLRLNGDVLTTPEQLRRMIFHEMGHWLDDMVPGYNGLIMEHARVRTNNFSELLQSLRIDHAGKEHGKGVVGMRDALPMSMAMSMPGASMAGVSAPRFPRLTLRFLLLRQLR